MAKVFVLMAQGFEEMELVITVDILRRAGVDAKMVSLNKDLEPVLGSRGIRMIPDYTLDSIDENSCDMVVLPGGNEGTERLGTDERVLGLLRRVKDRGRKIAAICAAPTVLVKAGVVGGKKVTSHPAVEARMTGVAYHQDRVVQDGDFITSRAAGTTFEFAYKLVEILVGKEKITEVNKGVLAHLP